MSNYTRQIDGGKTVPSDPDRAAEFDAILRGVHDRYLAGVPLTRRDLMRLVQVTLALVEWEGAK